MILPYPPFRDPKALNGSGRIALAVPWQSLDKRVSPLWSITFVTWLSVKSFSFLSFSHPSFFHSVQSPLCPVSPYLHTSFPLLCFQSYIFITNLLIYRSCYDLPFFVCDLRAMREFGIRINIIRIKQMPVSSFVFESFVEISLSCSFSNKFIELLNYRSIICITYGNWCS